MKWTATDVVDALRHAYGVDVSDLHTEEWAMLTEVPLRCPTIGPDGLPRKGYWGTNERTIDVLLVRNWMSGHGHRRIAIEVKVSRADYRNETDVKRAPAEEAAHLTAYAAPAGLIDPDTLPPHWGLVEVYESAADAAKGKGWPLGHQGVCKWRVRPTERTPACDMDYLVAAMARRASRAEERIRRAEDDVTAVPGLREEVVRLTAQLARRESAAHRERDRATTLRRQLAALTGDAVCADCEQPIAYNPHKHVWLHKERAHEATCRDLRAEAARVRREQATGARYLSGWPDPVEPKTMREFRAGIDHESADEAV